MSGAGLESDGLDIAGLVLVAHASRGGSVMVFRYPTVNRSSVSSATMDDFKERRNLSAASDGLSTSAVPPVLQERKIPEQESLEGYNMSSALIAPLLCPRVDLCDAPFELEYDDTLFVGWPVAAKKPSAVDESIPLPAAMDGDAEADYSGSPDFVGDMLKDDAGTKETVFSVKDDITAFNILFALRATRGRAETAKECVRIGRRLSLAVAYENSRVGYVHQEVHRMLVVRERWLALQEEAVTSKTPPPGHDALTVNLLKVSELARQLRALFVGLRRHGAATVAFNNAVTLSLCVPPVLKCGPVVQQRAAGVCEELGYKVLSPSVLRPYHCFLLSSRAISVARFLNVAVAREHGLGGDSSTVDATLIADVNEGVRVFLATCSPARSFREMSAYLAVSLSSIYRTAAHLQLHRLGTVVHTVTPRSVYTLNPNPPAHFDLRAHFDEIAVRLARALPAVQLTEVVSRFSGSVQALSQHREESSDALSRDLLPTVAWLLRNKVMVQLHTYVYLVDQSNVVPDGAESPSSGVREDSPRDDHATTVATAEHLHYLSSLKGADFASFRRLSAYFDGKHTLNEIVWRENLTREELVRLLKRFRGLVTLVVHE